MEHWYLWLLLWNFHYFIILARPDKIPLTFSLSLTTILPVLCSSKPMSLLPTSQRAPTQYTLWIKYQVSIPINSLDRPNGSYILYYATDRLLKHTFLPPEINPIHRLCMLLHGNQVNPYQNAFALQALLCLRCYWAQET